ncbi:hypothetical protein GALMADRAFT_215403 [Galerina marginata CBS 339.88]|uniref:Autophagy-related protein 17 n=1 Tax=Galerina marginata (strain CBS 339.88) TaxID=685588 RepID=A0A067SDY3_GALM3|nr:hypothetical protein GALMADRAFT_215403 [Galerina marginata CBS 339.88]
MSAVVQLLQDVQISREPPSKDRLTSAHRTFRNALEADNSLRSRVGQDLKELAHDIAKVETSFMAIHELMKAFDNRRMTANGEEFDPRWGQLRLIYVNTLSESKASTKELHDQIRELVNVFLPIVRSDDSEVVKAAVKMRRLEDYIANLEAFHEPAVQRGNQFLSLREEVSRFRGNLNDALPKIDNKMKTQIETLKSDIKFLENGMYELKNQFEKYECENHMLKDFAPNFTRSYESNCNGFVDRLRAVGNTGLTSPLAERERDHLRLLEDLAHVEKNETDMANIITILAEHDSWFSDISEKLSGIEGIWRMLVNDTSFLCYGLKPMEAEDDDTLYNLRANSLRPVYEALESALAAYLSAI